MTLIRILFMIGLTLGVAACSTTTSKFKQYDGPEVTRVAVFKERRKLFLFNGDKVLKSYDFELGFAPVGPKQFEGDGKTPEGRYLVDKRNPNSNYHLSVGISYPNRNDMAFAQQYGLSPGGDIFIHGQKSKFDKGGDDWTAGCIAVTNREIEDIYAMVRNGTVIDLYP